MALLSTEAYGTTPTDTPKITGIRVLLFVEGLLKHQPRRVAPPKQQTPTMGTITASTHDGHERYDGAIPVNSKDLLSMKNCTLLSTTYHNTSKLFVILLVCLYYYFNLVRSIDSEVLYSHPFTIKSTKGTPKKSIDM